MSCILRISGELLDVEVLLAGTSLAAYRVWMKGQSRALAGKPYSDSGAYFLVSDADFDDFDRQVVEATAYLEQHALVVAKMVDHPGVENAVLDFAVSLYEDHVAQFSFLPPKLVRLAGSAGLGLEVSHYACSHDHD
jgi:hypothetical protein